MQHHQLVGEKKVIDLIYPDSWDELSRSQAIYAGNLIYLLLNKELEVDQFRKLMVDKFIRRNNSHNDKLSIDDAVNMWANEYQLAETVNFFFKVSKEKDAPEKFELLPTGIENLVPFFRHRGRKYKGPGAFLSGMTFVQFKDSIACSQKFMQGTEEEWLDRLVATLYTEGGKKYDIKDVDQRAKRLKKLNRGIKMMAFCYFMGCMHTLRTDGGGGGIEIDGITCRFSLLFKKRKNQGNDGIGMLGVLMTLAESGVFGNIKQTADSDIWDVLPRLYQLTLDAIEMERILKRNER